MVRLVSTIVLLASALSASGQHVLDRPDFSVTFPARCGAIKASEMPVDSGVIHVWASDNTPATCRAAMWELPAVPQLPGGALHGALSGMLARATEKATEEFISNGCPAVRANFSNQDVFGRAEVILRGKRIYVIAITGTAAEVASPRLRSLFDSFKLKGAGCEAVPKVVEAAHKEFVIEYPPGSSPPERKVVEPKENGVWMETSIAPGGVLALVMFVPARDITQLPLKDLLMAVYRTQGTLEADQAFTKNGHRAHRAIARLKNAVARAEAVAGKRNAYVIALSSPDEAALKTPAADRFFESFRILD